MKLKLLSNNIAVLTLMVSCSTEIVIGRLFLRIRKGLRKEDDIKSKHNGLLHKLVESPRTCPLHLVPCKYQDDIFWPATGELLDRHRI